MQTLQRIQHDQWLELRLNRPEVRNASSDGRRTCIFGELSQDKIRRWCCVALAVTLCRGDEGHARSSAQPTNHRPETPSQDGTDA